MMKLYEISEKYTELFEMLDSISNDDDLTEEEKAEREQAWYDTLEMLEDDFETVAENVAAHIKELKAEADALKAEEQRLNKRRKTKERRAEGLKSYLLDHMQAVNIKKIDRPMAVLSIRNNAEMAVFADEEAFISNAMKEHEELLRYKTPEIDKTAVKKYLQDGGELDGVRLERSQSLTIK